MCNEDVCVRRGARGLLGVAKWDFYLNAVYVSEFIMPFLPRKRVWYVMCDSFIVLSNKKVFLIGKKFLTFSLANFPSADPVMR